MNESVSWWLTQIGAPYNDSDPFAAVYPVITKRNKPAGLISPDFENQAEACLRYRGLIYWKQNPGDCGQWSSRTSSIPTSANNTVQAEAESAGDSALGSIPVIGGIIASIFGDIFAEHTQAVQAEQTNICNVTQAANAAIYSIDAAVAAGQITAAQGIAAMQQTVAQLIAQLQQTAKTATDASVYFQGFLRAHLDFANEFYPAIAPAGISSVSGIVAKVKSALVGITGANATSTESIVVLLAIVALIVYLVRRKR